MISHVETFGGETLSELMRFLKNPGHTADPAFGDSPCFLWCHFSLQIIKLGTESISGFHHVEKTGQHQERKQVRVQWEPQVGGSNTAGFQSQAF